MSALEKSNLSREQNIAVAKNEKKSKQGMSRVMTASYDMGTNVTESDLVIQDWNVDKIKYTEVEAVDIIKPEPLKPSPSNWRQEVELDEKFDPAKFIKGVKGIFKGKGPFNVTGTQAANLKKGRLSSYKPPSKTVSNQIQLKSIKNKLSNLNTRVNTPIDATSSLGTSKRLVKNPDFKNLTKKLAKETEEKKKVVKRLITKKNRTGFTDDNRLANAQKQKGLTASQKKKIKEFEKLEKKGQLNLFSKNTQKTKTPSTTKDKTKGSNIVPVEKSSSKVTSKKGPNIDRETEMFQGKLVDARTGETLNVDAANIAKKSGGRTLKRTTKTEPYYVTKQNKKITLNTTTPQKGLELKGSGVNTKPTFAKVTTGNQIPYVQPKTPNVKGKGISTRDKLLRYGIGGVGGYLIGKSQVRKDSPILDDLPDFPKKPVPNIPDRQNEKLPKDQLMAKKNNKKSLNAHYDWRNQLDDDVLYRLDKFNEDWQKVNKKDKTDGMSQKAVNAYKRENPGSKLKTAVTGKVKKGSKASKRRKSFCARSNGQKKMHNIDCSKTPDKAICKARRRWNC